MELYSSGNEVTLLMDSPSFLGRTAKGTRVDMEKLSSESSFIIAELIRALKAVWNFVIEGERKSVKGMINNPDMIRTVRNTLLHTLALLNVK